MAYSFLLSLGLLICLLVFESTPARAENVLRWSSQGDAMTLDAHSQNEGLTLTFLQNVMEPLIERDQDMGKEPGLAVSWALVEPTVWEFKLREGVRFHDGTPFTAEDVVFTFDRALSATSDFKESISTVTGAQKVDDFTVRITTSEPNPILPDQVTSIHIVSKAWSEANGVVAPANAATREESYAVRHANGTGPFKVDLREPDVRTLMVKNDDWWGLTGEDDHNVDRIIFTPINNASTRVAALLSGELDFVLDPPLQDLRRIQRTDGLKVVERSEVRSLFLGMNQQGNALRGSSITDRNPFQDVRVREAVNRAINAQAIQRAVMRGFSQPAGGIIPPGVHGYAEDLDARAEFDPERARALLAEAGYPDGFEVTLDCTNDRYVNDEATCQAVVGMLARVGIDVTLSSRSKTLHFPMIQNNETDFYILGWGAATMDAHYHLTFLGLPDSSWNQTGLDDPRLVELINTMATETNLEMRDTMIREAQERMRASFMYAPLHHTKLAWAMTERLDLPVPPDNQPYFRMARFR